MLSTPGPTISPGGVKNEAQSKEFTKNYSNLSLSARSFMLAIMKNAKHIIWDWNGTLLDDRWLCVESINQALKKKFQEGQLYDI